MKHFFTAFLTLFLLLSLSPVAYAQKRETIDEVKGSETVNIHKLSKKEKMKKGFSFLPYPNLSYSSDLGLQVGVSAELLDFGTGEEYPHYRQRFFAQFSYFTTNSFLYRFFYDSDRLIKGVRTNIDLTYLPQPLYDFYGYNGYAAPLNEEMHKGFNKMKRNLGRLTIDLEGTIYNNFKWYAGLTGLSYEFGNATVEGYNEKPTLFDLYQNAGLIKKEELAGGAHLYLKGGVAIDTRDSEIDPTKGIRSELFFAFDPGFARGGEFSHVKMSFSHSTFKQLIGEVFTLATRVGYHGTMGGADVPFYMQTNINTIYMRRIVSEGLGGQTTLRGVLTNRVVGNGVAWANIETRYRMFNSSFLGKNFYFAVNPFLDFGAVIQTYRMETMKRAASLPYGNMIYSGEPERLHVSGGIGLKLVIDRNIVFTGEVGKAFSNRDGSELMFSFGSNYIF